MNSKYIRTLFDLERRIVLITGGAGFLAKTYAEVLLDAGAKVVLADIDNKKLQGRINNLRKSYKDVFGFDVDITNEAKVKNLVKRIILKHKKIDVLVNNAAINPKVEKKGLEGSTSFEDVPLDYWQRDLEVNLTGMFLISREVGKQMLKRKKGVIINISSIYGFVSPNQGLYKPTKGKQTQFKPVSYATSKAAVINFTRYLATYYAKDGIRINCLVPGGVYENQPEDFLRRYAKLVPIGRMAKPEELAGPILFLASDASSYMTGATLVVDGGWIAW